MGFANSIGRRIEAKCFEKVETVTSDCFVTPKKIFPISN